ncbi:hypothetical protein L1987_61732 [Smallanthus sonchifolius]|uniref:Uncharacterized protein n=1 Tax=Smallanthus sonchifolius TaxID=185202 RepID=A0ACB9C8E2_9ASTR|nr:hypothetical protein L1987_61732 [Smallanthus sonchifolius]
MVIHKSLSEFAKQVQKCQDYIGALDEERKKILVFERELPLCLELVSQAIERCRQQMCMTMTESFDGQSDQYSDQTSSEGPVLEEFIPIKLSSPFTNEDIDDQQQQKQELTGSKDWLASAQLSIQAPDPIIEEECDNINPFRKKKTTGSSSADKAGGGGVDGGDHDGGDKGRSNKKERRCWSPELHRRFLHALQQLGGAHVATPKQIKEIMNVNGLTSDEIKSHLQKVEPYYPQRRTHSPASAGRPNMGATTGLHISANR